MCSPDIAGHGLFARTRQSGSGSPLPLSLMAMLAQWILLARSVLLQRRVLLALAAVAFFAVAPQSRATPETDAVTGPAVPVEQLDDALLVAMKAGQSTPFLARYRALVPVIEQVFDLDRVLAESVGFSWPTVAPEQKARLEAAFLRYTVATYVANFNSYSGQGFEVVPGVRDVGNGEVVVRTRLLRPNQSPVKLDYVMRKGAAGWKAVDVLTNGSISRVAVQRADFQESLASGGVPALTAGLDRKVASLSGGVVG